MWRRSDCGGTSRTTSRCPRNGMIRAKPGKSVRVFPVILRVWAEGCIRSHDSAVEIKSMAEGATIASRASRAVKVAQGLAVSLIVLFHANHLLYREGMSFRGSPTAIAILGPALLSLFFFAAGQSFGQRKLASLRVHTINRTDGYLWILIVWNVIYIAAFKIYQYVHLTGESFSDSSILMSGLNLRDVIKFFILPSNVTWFVYCVFLYVIVSYFARTFHKTLQLLVVVLCLDALAWYRGLFQVYVNLQYLEIFLIACLYGDSIIGWLARSRAIVRLVLMILYVAASYGAFVWLPQDCPVVATLVRLAGLSSLMAAALFIHDSGRGSLFSTIANFMLPIYLMHSLLLYAFVSTIHVLKLKTDSSIVMALSTPAVGLACLFVCILIFRSVKPMGVLIFRPKGFKPVASLVKMASARS